VAANCKAGVTSGGNGTTAGNGTLAGPMGVAVDSDTGKVYVANRDASRIDVYDANGVFERAFGFDVAASGPGNTGTGYETCVAANGDVCKSGVGGNGVGQLGLTNIVGMFDIVVTPPDANAATGKVYLADTNNRRVSTYGLDGSAPSSFGTTTDFANLWPRDLAIDGSVVYASNSANQNEVKRYNLNTASFLAPIAVATLPTDGIASTQATNGLDIDTDTGNLLVARANAAAGVVEIGTPAGPPAFIDRHLTTVVAVGVAANPVTDEIIEFLNHRVLILNAGSTPAFVTIGATTDVTATAATLTATIDSTTGGLPTDYRFQVSVNGVDWTTVASGTVAAGVNQTVSGAATGLAPNTLYRVRVVANRTLGNLDVISAEGSLITDATAPTIVSTAVDLLAPESVRLSAYVNPNSSQTSYRFEWGTDPDSLPNRIPAPNRSLGAGPSDVLAADVLSGLEPNTTYHYRLLAVSTLGGTSTGPVHSFTTRTSPLPARGAELVSPAVKSPNADVQDYLPEDRQLDYLVAPDGSNIFYTLSFGTPDATAGGETRYLARRGGAGWASEQMTPPLTSADTLPGAEGVWAGRYEYVAPDLSCGVLKSAQPLTPDASTAVRAGNGGNLFRRNSDGSYQWLTPEPSNPAVAVAVLGGYSIRGSSSDCDNVVFETTYQFAGATSGIYRSHGGVVSDVAVRPDGSVAPSPGVGSSVEDTVRTSVKRVVSDDASHVYFTATSNGGNPPGTGNDTGKRALYLHREGQPTIKVSGSKTATVNEKAVFQIASRDGEKVAFMANYGLTASSSSGPVASSCTNAAPQPCALYVYDVATDQLVDVSATSDPANTNGATVGGVLGASDDMSRVYFAAQGQLVPGKGRTYAQNIAGGASSNNATFNIYIYTAGGGLDYVGLNTGDDLRSPFRNVLVTATRRSAQVTPDGGSLLFTSAANNVGYDSKGIPQAYLYSADAGELMCVSCRRDGEPPLASTRNPVPDRYAGQGYAAAAFVQPIVFRNLLVESRVVSDDGLRVVFTMHDALTPGAVEGNQNIYLWDRGALTLLDSGMFSVPTFFLSGDRNPTPYVVGMSPTGDDVFIRTPSKFVAADIDGMKDLYDFRVGGGFPDAPGPGTPCDVLGDGCQGGGAGQTGGTVVSDKPAGDGNEVAGERPTLSVAGLSAAARRKAARSGVLPVRVTVNRAGMVRLSAQARLGRKARRVGSTSKSVRKPGVVKVGVRLSTAARKRLRSGKALLLTVRVTQAGAHARSMSVRLPGAGS